MAYYDAAGLDELRGQLTPLQQQERMLRLQHDIEVMERQLRELETATPCLDDKLNPRHGLPRCRPEHEPASTPYTGHARAKLFADTELRARDVSYDRDTVDRSTDHVSECDNNQEPSRWDRFVTHRRSNKREPIDSNAVQEQSNAHRRQAGMMKPATYDGTGSWQDYKAHFEACAKINNWSEMDKGLYLAVSLRGQAQGVLGNITGDFHDYDALMTTLQERFAPPNQTELYRAQLRDRHQKASETLSELAQDIRRLTNLSYPSAPAEVKETLAKEQFMDALVSSDMRLRVKQARPVNLNDAVRHAVELEAFVRAERAKLDGQGLLNSTFACSGDHAKKESQSELQLLRKTVERLEEQMKSLVQEKSCQDRKPDHPRDYKPERDPNRFRRRSPRRCFECGSENHLRLKCPRLNRQSTDENLKNDGGGKASSVNALGSGLFINVEFCGQSLSSLVDTGATLTILSTRVWNGCRLSKQGNLTSYDKTLISASGNSLNVRGRTKVNLEIGSGQFETDVVVADVDNDLILGLDFMQQHRCSIDVTCKSLTIGSQTLKMSCRGSIGCYRIAVAENVEVPAMSETIIQGKPICPAGNLSGLFLIEQNEQGVRNGPELVARTLVEGNENVPVRIMNLTNEGYTLHTGANIAQMTPVSNVSCTQGKSQPQSVVPDHLQDLYERTVTGMTQAQCKEISKLLQKYSDTFSRSDDDLGRTGIIKHKIETGNAHPIKQPLRRSPVHMNEDIDNAIDDMLKKDVIQPSASPWASGIVMVRKKDGTRRFCVDYRKLNDVTTKDSYPIPRIDDSLEQLSGATWFSCLDLNSGYWQVEVDEADREKTAFSSRRGLFEFKVMPFGLCNAPATFERLMEYVLSGLNWQICLIYLDDIIVHGDSFESMISNLDEVLAKLQEAGLKLKPRKCQLFCEEVEYLGHLISASGIKTDPKKTETIRNWPTPHNVTEVRSFIGLCSYYRRFIAGFATIAKPLHRLTEKGRTFSWTDDCNKAFETLKACLCQTPPLAHPDFSKPFILDTDASDVGIGAVLSQDIEGSERVIAYASKSLSKSERRYCVTRKELYALVFFVKYFRHYLYGKQFTIRTDHGSLRWLMNFKDPEGQVARWLEVLSSYDMKIVHRPGRVHSNADGLSRVRCKQCNMMEDEVYTEDNNESCTLGELNWLGPQDSANEILDIGTAQDNDALVSKVKKWVQSKSKPETKVISCESNFVKSLVSQWERLDIQGGILVRRWDVLGTQLVQWQSIVPLSQRRIVLNYSHDIKASGHLGIRKTVARIQQSYYWPGLQNDVRTYVNGCEVCAKSKDPTKTKRAPMGVVQSGYPMERLAIDILGDFPVTERGNKYILVIGDYFTKWTECHPLPNIEARTVATVLIEQVVSRFGIPRQLHSDQGRQFESKLFSEMCHLLQIEKTRTTPYHPQSDGMVERFNRTLVAMLGAFVNSNHTDWDEQLQYVMMAYRSTEHESTGFTPNLCMLGRETTCPLDIVYAMPSSIKAVPVNRWVWELQDRLETAHAQVRQNTGESMKRQKRHHDGRLSFETFDTGEKVYVFFPVKRVGCSSKLTSYWKGPFTILDKLSDVTYKVNCGKGGLEQVIHCDRIKKAKSQILSQECMLDVPTTETPEQKGDVNDSYLDTNNYETDLDKLAGRRKRTKPVWMNDYVLSHCRSPSMPPKTKVTPRKPSEVCPSCRKEIQTNFRYHLLMCVGKEHGCEPCGKTFKSKASYTQHIRRVHGGGAATDESEADSVREQDKGANLSDGSMSESETNSEDELDKDPNVEIGVEEEEEDSRNVVVQQEENKRQEKASEPENQAVVRKRTMPVPVYAGVPKKRECTVSKPATAPNITARANVTPGNQPYRCDHCDIVYGSVVMQMIHMGCHTMGDPFKCNVCGASTENRYEFYSHITRGHAKN